MTLLNIRGVDVEFPFRPYGVQLMYMTKVIEALQTGKNAILESPTGTGKTLCLLCSALAWRRSEIKKRASIAQIPDATEPDYPLGWGQSDVIPGESGEPSLPAAPRIIYASRTHSQLTQVVNELKRTAYAKDAKISILGSREQMCVHPEVSKQTNNTAMIHMCRNKVNKHLCNFYNNVENVRKSGSFTNEVLDIEELVTLGKKRNACPYYATREQSKEPDCGIIFTPYNYLLDRKARRSHNLEVSGNIIIFDEAHNLEKMCEESASFDLTSYDIAHCVEEVGDLLTAVDKLSQTGTVPDGYEAGQSSALSEFDKTELATLKVLFIALEKELDKIELSGMEKCRTEKGRYMFEYFAQVNLSFGTHEALLDLIDKVVAYLSTLSNSFQTRGTALQRFSEVIKIVFSAAGGQNPAMPSSLLTNNVVSEMMMEELSKFYRVHIREELPDTFNKATFQASSSKPKKPKRILSYWCFSPGYAMRDLIACGVKNLVLTSGTLSPLESFTCELQVDFPISLQNTHVIDNHQVFVATMTKGIEGRRLESTYRARNNTALAKELGKTLVKIARNCPGGLLVFFPSYFAMSIYSKTWGEFPNDIMREIDLVKPCTVEPKNKHELKGAIEKYYSDVAKPQGGTFFAVCRGKVSEGLDFANDNGRAVVIIGLPFPPSKDPKVRLKMEFLESLRVQGATRVIKGDEWYRLQALRAVNQAIGRVIRHRFDYGAILLCDYRYQKTENSSELPKWIQGRINVFDDCEKGIRRLKSFFCSIKQKEKVRLQQTSPGVKEIAFGKDVASKDCDDESKAGTSKNSIFFGGQSTHPKTDAITQSFPKPSTSTSQRTKSKAFLSIPKASDFSNHVPSSRSVTLPQPTPNGSCSGCSTGGPYKRKRTSEDEDSKSLVPIKNVRKKAGKGIGLLDALDKHDVVDLTQDDEDAPAEECAHRISTHLLVMDKKMDDERRGTQKKKIKIVANKAPTKAKREKTVEIDVKQDCRPKSNPKKPIGKEVKQDELPEEEPEEVSFDEKDLSFGAAGAYLEAVRKVLKGESYAEFKDMLQTKARDYDAMLPVLAKLFIDKEAHHPLFRAFLRFVKGSENVKKFKKACYELTGKYPMLRR